MLHPPEASIRLELERWYGASGICAHAVSVMQQISPQFGEEKVKACAEQALTGAFQDKFYQWEQDWA